MNSLEICYFLRRNRHTQKYFMNVYPVDLLPRNIPRHKTKIIVVNFSPPSSARSHWLTIFIDNNEIDVFCTIGKSLQENPYIQQFVRRNKRRYLLYNTNQIQSHGSDVCGELSCLIALARSKGIRFNTFLQQFRFKNKILSDKKAKYLFDLHYVFHGDIDYKNSIN